MLNTKTMSEEDRERRKEYMKNYCYKRKDLLIHLINRVEELENIFFYIPILIRKKVFFVNTKWHSCIKNTSEKSFNFFPKVQGKKKK